MKKIELLAPAGNFECLVAAVQSGADAIYLSGKNFGARSFAENFDLEELERAVDYCHLREVKVYVTVNTLVSNAEIDELCNYLKFLNKIGADGIIVQDIGIVNIAAEIVPSLPIHASTQMTVHNAEGVKLLEKLGIKRVVLSREVSLKNIKKISEKTTAELEVFGHGALCMCYSGQCLMSSIIGGRSGNRGKCAQPCRLPYSVNKSKNPAFYMSLKDLSSLGHISEMKNSGVTSLKIEGRMKGPAYVAAVVGIYRKYIDNPASVQPEDIKILDSVFNRGGLTDGYLTGKIGKDMFAFDKPDNPYRMGCDKTINNILNSIKSKNKKLKLTASIEIKLNSFVHISVCCNDFKFKYISEVKAEKAVKSPLRAENVILQLRKTGGTPFEFTDISTDLEDDLFLTAGALNSLRREALEKFENAYLNSFKRENISLQYSKVDNVMADETEYVCEITTIEQFNAVKEYDFSYFYIPMHIILMHFAELDKYKEKIVIVPPSIIREDEFDDTVSQAKKLLDCGFGGILATNISLIKEFKNYNVFGSFRLNVFNSFALSSYKNCGLKLVELSPELNLKQLKALKKPLATQVMVYGRLPLMITENCVIKNDNPCPCNGNNYLTDRMGMKFPVIKDGNSCRSVILNCKKTFMGFDTDKLKDCNIQAFRLYFTDEDSDECIRVCNSFFKNSGYRPEDFTKGHFLKGVK